jgi:hypothetical protein
VRLFDKELKAMLFTDDLAGLADALRAKGVLVEGEIAPRTGE